MAPSTSVTSTTLATTRVIVSPAASTSCWPASTLPIDSPISAWISLAASALRCARSRTSAATTAKPRPWSPARAASTAAFRARMLVWKAMPSTAPRISPTRRALASILRIVSATCCMRSDACAATSRDWLASLSARCAVLGVPARAGRQFLDAAGGLLQRGRLLLRALRELRVAFGDDAGAGGNRIGAGTHLPHDVRERGADLQDRLVQQALRRSCRSRPTGHRPAARRWPGGR